MRTHKAVLTLPDIFPFQLKQWLPQRSINADGSNDGVVCWAVCSHGIDGYGFEVPSAIFLGQKSHQEDTHSLSNLYFVFAGWLWMLMWFSSVQRLLSEKAKLHKNRLLLTLLWSDKPTIAHNCSSKPAGWSRTRSGNPRHCSSWWHMALQVTWGSLEWFFK